MATASLLAGLLPALGGIGGILKKVGTFAGGLLADIGHGNIHSFGDFGRSLALNASRAITNGKIPATDSLKMRVNKPGPKPKPPVKPKSAPEATPVIKMPPLPQVPQATPKTSSKKKKIKMTPEDPDPTDPRNNKEVSRSCSTGRYVKGPPPDCSKEKRKSKKKKKKPVFVTNKTTK